MSLTSPYSRDTQSEKIISRFKIIRTHLKYFTYISIQFQIRAIFSSVLQRGENVTIISSRQLQLFLNV